MFSEGYEVMQPGHIYTKRKTEHVLIFSSILPKSMIQSISIETLAHGWACDTADMTRHDPEQKTSHAKYLLDAKKRMLHN